MRPAGSSSRVGKVVFSLILLATAAVVGVRNSASLSTKGINNGNTMEFGMASASERAKLEREFGEFTGLSSRELRALRTAFETNPREAYDLAMKTLSEEQRTSAVAFMVQQWRRREERLAKMLSANDLRAIQERQARRRNRFMNRVWSLGNPAGRPPQ